MTDKKRNIDSKAIAKDMEGKIKHALKDGNNLQDIPNLILDVLKHNGIELPEKVLQAMQEYQTKK